MHLMDFTLKFNKHQIKTKYLLNGGDLVKGPF